MRVDEIIFHRLGIPLINPLRAAHGETFQREVVIVECRSGDVVGWGECSALSLPTYGSEWSQGEYLLLENVIKPRLLGNEFENPTDVMRALADIRGHSSSKCAIEAAALQIFSLEQGISIDRYINAASRMHQGDVELDYNSDVMIKVCLVVDLRDHEMLHKRLAYASELGACSIKCKFQPDDNIDVLRKLRSEYPHMSIGVDANESFTPTSVAHRMQLGELDTLGLAFIEQPYLAEEFRAYAELRAMINTPIFLDESIRSVTSLRNAIELQICDGVTLKPSQIGGYSECIRAAAIASEFHISVRLGGMLETAIGRYMNLVIASQPNFKQQPAEISPDGWWFESSLSTTPVQMNDGELRLQHQPCEVDRNQLMAMSIPSA